MPASVAHQYRSPLWPIFDRHILGQSCRFQEVGRMSALVRIDVLFQPVLLILDPHLFGSHKC
jgi:hypothetical protein